MEIEAVIFDMDGLMLDSEAFTRPIWEQVFHEFGYQFKPDIYYQVIGRSIVDTGKIFADHYGEEFPFYEMRARRVEVYEEKLKSETIAIKPGLINFFDSLELKKLPFAVATSTYRDAAFEKLDSVGLLERIRVLVGGDEIKNSKPEPDIFLEAANRLGVDPSKCVVLEDSHSGVRAAKAAGMTVYLVPDLVPATDEIRQLADFVCEDLNQASAQLFSKSNS